MVHLFYDILCRVLSNATTQHLHLGCNASTGFLWIHDRGTVSPPDQHSPDMFHLSLFHQPCSASSTETHHRNRSPPEANDINNVAFWNIMPCMLQQSYNILCVCVCVCVYVCEGGGGTAAILRLFFCSENGGNRILQNVVNHLLNQMVSHLRKQQASYITGRTTSNATMISRTLMILLQKEISQCSAHCRNL